MSETLDGKHARKELLKALREARKQSIVVLSRKMKEQKKIIERIKEQLGEGPKTVPEMASGLGLPSSEIMWYVAALKKYGEVAEEEKEGGYFRYEPAGSGALPDSGREG
jgi:predicted transcriptional regulator